MRSRILSVLKAAGSRYISGEAIASELGISRTAVWKHINELRQSGYNIDSHSRSGYRLQDSPDCLLPEEIKIGLDTEIMGREIIYFDDIPSTNNQAKIKARQGADEGTVIVSEAQSIGKGRLDRSFFSPHGKGIWFSVILRPPFLPQDAPKCTLLAAVAVASAMRSFGIEAGIKWPNDILCQGRKLTGILTEMSAEMDRINYVVIGIGINVNILLEDFPEDLREKAGSMAMIKGELIDRPSFFRAVLKELDICYREICAEGFSVLIDRWRSLSVTLGQEINVIGINESFSGKAIDIDDDGALLVEAEGSLRRVLAGDVSIRPKLQ